MNQSANRQEAYACLRGVESLRENLIEALQELLDQAPLRTQFSVAPDLATHH